MESVENPFPMANCLTCGRLFIKFSGKVCSECKTAEQIEMESVVSFIRARPGADIAEAALALNIPVARVMRYSDEGLFRRYELSVNYPCRICRGDIAHGVVCLRCNDKLNKQIVSLRESITEPQVSRPVEPAVTPVDRRTGSWGRADDLYSSGSITLRREKEKKPKRSGGFHR